MASSSSSSHDASKRPSVFAPALHRLTSSVGATSLAGSPAADPVHAAFQAATGSPSASTLGAEQLRRFAVDVQGYSAAAADALAAGHASMTEAEFARWLLTAPSNALFDEQRRTLWQDMDRPLHHYYISSSHNTYLTHDQLKGPSSVDAYVNAFRLGAKSVEIDCWDGPHDEPIVTHGHTLCGRILFKDVVAAVKDHAFAVSDFPVIISLEVHCGLKQQAVMAKHLSSILGELVVVSPPEDHRTTLPSPNDLRRKILIKNKRLPAGVHEDEYEAELDQNDQYEELDAHVHHHIFKRSPSSGSAHSAHSADGASTHTVPHTADDLKDLKKHPSNIKVKVSRLLSNLVVFTEATTFKSFAHCMETYQYSHMSSFGESKALKEIHHAPDHFIQYNQRWLSRIYPKGSRVDSSNYDPTQMWNVGCALVALNFQTMDRNLQLNLGQFMQNGGCGYVLKPDFLLGRGPKAPAQHLSVRVLFAQGLPGSDHHHHLIPHALQRRLSKDSTTTPPTAAAAAPPPHHSGDGDDYYVHVTVVGHPSDNADKATPVTRARSPAPAVWHADPLQFHVTHPELALVRIAVALKHHLHSDHQVGVFVVPVTCLRPGYRHCVLRDTVHFAAIEGAVLCLQLQMHQ